MRYMSFSIMDFVFLKHVSLMIYSVMYLFLQLLLHAIDTFNVNVVLVLGQVDAFIIIFVFPVSGSDFNNYFYNYSFSIPFVKES